MKVAITNIGSSFSVSRQNPETEEINNLFAVVDIKIEDGQKLRKPLYIKYVGPYNVFGDWPYEFSHEIIGNYWPKEGYGKIFEAGCEVQDKKNKISYMCYFTGGDFTNSWCRNSVAKGFVNFLNTFYQFKSLEDYIAYDKANNNEEWDDKKMSEKILELSKIIELYKKYYEINRALPITHEIEDLINKRLKSLLKTP